MVVECPFKQTSAVRYSPTAFTLHSLSVEPLCVSFPTNPGANAKTLYVVKPIRTTEAASQERLPAVVPRGAASSDSLSVVLVTFAASSAPGVPESAVAGRDRRRPGRCCTNRDWPARCPPTGSSPAEAIRHWSAEGGHPIEDLTAEDDLTPLPGWPPGPEAISDNGLVSEERVLHPALTMVP